MYYFLISCTLIGGKACTLILRGASSHLLDEAERSMHDALCVLTETGMYVFIYVCGINVMALHVYSMYIYIYIYITMSIFIKGILC